MKKDDISFIARHYRRGALSTRQAWDELGIAPSRRWFTRGKVAAAVASLVIFGASAVAVFHAVTPHPATPVETIAEPAAVAVAPETVKEFAFDNASLSQVVTAIKKTYRVEIQGVPANSDALHLTLRFKGDATQLLAAINHILDTNMTIIAL